MGAMDPDRVYSSSIADQIESNVARGRPWWHRLGRKGDHVVYVLWALSGQVRGHADVDAGASLVVGARLRAHSRKWWWPLVSYQLASILWRSSRAEAEALEARLIHEYRPSINRAGIPVGTPE